MGCGVLLACRLGSDRADAYEATSTRRGETPAMRKGPIWFALCPDQTGYAITFLEAICVSVQDGGSIEGWDGVCLMNVCGRMQRVKAREVGVCYRWTTATGRRVVFEGNRRREKVDAIGGRRTAARQRCFWPTYHPSPTTHHPHDCQSVRHGRCGRGRTRPRLLHRSFS